MLFQYVLILIFALEWHADWRFCTVALAPPRALITDPQKARLRINNDRHVYPGDYVAHKDYGIGKYLGLREVDLRPSQKTTRVWAMMVLVQYQDAVLSWYQQYTETELWFYRSSNVDDFPLSTVVEPKKWQKSKDSAERSSKSSALNLCLMMAIRNNIHRSPYLQDDPMYRAFETDFPFEPTFDQLACFRDIENDMTNNTRPMDRLICGDVGFGKTEVAIRAIYRAIKSGRQVALLAPTKILVAQHKRSLEARMPDVNVQLLLGGGGSKSQAIKNSLADGKCNVVVGTHSLLNPKISFQNLGLLVIDEEQRFGVIHKEKLKALSGNTDVLTLSATPIPRTLQLSLGGLRDMSLLNSPPVGRRSVTTEVGTYNETIIKKAISAEVARGGQVFIVCPKISQVEQQLELFRRVMPDVRFACAHGRMGEELLPAIDAFADGKQDVLVATTVIENGIDMPNVNTIVVMFADQFGMGQLYQLRGRVGRSDRQAYAYFLTNNATSITVEAEQRLEYLRLYNAPGSGYDLSRKDMDMRGFGTLFGNAQSGVVDVGMDLQQEILATQVAKLKSELILSVPETRIKLDTKIERDGVVLLGQIPPEDDLMAVSRWEASLAETILNKWKGDESNQYLGPLLSASNATVLQLLNKKWRDENERLPSAVTELVMRTYARLICRRAGVTQVSVDNESGSIICKLPRVTPDKWRSFLEKAVPANLGASVSFNSTHTPEGEPVGRIEIKGLGDGGAYETIPADFLKCIKPMAQAVEEKLLVGLEAE